MMEEKQTEISTLGEFGLIDRLTKDIEHVNDSTLTGVGDDCAVMSYKDTDVLVSTDLLVEGVHFDLTICAFEASGLQGGRCEFLGYICHERPSASNHRVACHFEAFHCGAYRGAV